MNKRDLSYKLYEAGVIAFEDYQCVDCGGSNVLVDSFYACAVEIDAAAGRAGFVAGYMLCNDGSPLIKHNYEGFADQYAESIRQER